MLPGAEEIHHPVTRSSERAISPSLLLGGLLLTLNICRWLMSEARAIVYLVLSVTLVTTAIKETYQSLLRTEVINHC